MSTPVPDQSPRALERHTGASQSIVREVPLGIAEIAQLLEVKRATVNMWRARGVLPEPDGFVSDSPYWWPATIRDFAIATNRVP